MPQPVSTNSPSHARCPLWALSENTTVVIGLMVAFFLGMAVTMFAYQVGVVAPVR